MYQFGDVMFNHLSEDWTKFGYKWCIKIKMLKHLFISLATYWNENVTTLWKNKNKNINDHNPLDQNVATITISNGYINLWWFYTNGEHLLIPNNNFGHNWMVKSLVLFKDPLLHQSSNPF
jgi:hypothetical protein